MVEADTDNHVKLCPTSILDIYKVFEHIASAVHGHSVSALDCQMLLSGIKLSNRKMLLDLMKRLPWCSYSSYCRSDDAT
jgi:hypothetical protein